MPSEAIHRGDGARVLLVRGGHALEGEVQVPGDKSLSHRALLLAAIADGTTQIHGLSSCADVRRTIEALRTLDVSIEGAPPDEVVVHGVGTRGLSGPEVSLECGDSGTTMRLLAGLLAGQDRRFTLAGDPGLSQRPMLRVVEPLRLLGASIDTSPSGRPPIVGLSVVAPGDLDPIEHPGLRSGLHGAVIELERASAQVGSAILLAGLNAVGETLVQYPRPVRDHTERLLESMGAPLSRDGLTTRLNGPVERLLPPGGGHYDVARDPSGAAFALSAAAMMPGSVVAAMGVNVNPGRTGLFEILRRMGADIMVREGPERHGEPTADIVVSHSDLRGAEIGADLVPMAIDELPLFAVIATQARGRSVLRDAAELRVKECDRIAAIVAGLQRMGAHITELPDGFAVDGPTRLHGATVDGHGDHRIVMALAVAGMVADGETRVTDGERTDDSYPGFVSALRDLGVWISRTEVGEDKAAVR